MTAQKGSLVLLKVGDGAIEESFTTIGGMRITKLALNTRLIDASNVDSGAWRKLQDGGGIRFVTVSGIGLFTDSTAEEILRQTAFGGLGRNFQISFGNGNELQGAFMVSYYERAGEYTSEETTVITLESAGVVVFSS